MSNEPPRRPRSEPSDADKALLEELREAHELQIAYGDLRRRLILKASEAGITTRAMAQHLDASQSTISYWLTSAREESNGGPQAANHHSRRR